MSEATVTTPSPARHGIGGSQAAAALGLHPYMAPITLWQELVGELPSFEGNQFTYWGLKLEPVLRQEYSDRHQVLVHVPQESRYHPELSWARATPDGIVVDDDGRWLHGVELKTGGSFTAERWGEEGTDEVPAEYLVQCQHSMLVTGLDHWDLPVLLGGNDWREYRVERDEELIESIADEVGRFWAEHVLARVPPPLDGSDGYRDYLASRYPHTRADFIKADAEADALVVELRALMDEAKDLEAEIDKRKNAVRACIGEAAGLITSIGKVHYKPRKGAPNWKRVATELAEAHGVDDRTLAKLADINRNAGSRPLVPPRSKR